MDPITWKEKVTQLENLLEKGWDVPFQKRKHLLKSPTAKLDWLYKNLSIRNEKHDHYREVMTLLKDLVG